MLKVGFCFYVSAFWESPFLQAAARLKTPHLALSHTRAFLLSSLLPARIQNPANISNDVLLKLHSLTISNPLHSVAVIRNHKHKSFKKNLSAYNYGRK